MGLRVPTFGSQGLIVLLCCINLLNYIDRGIIAGAPESFRHFITDSLGVSVTNQSVYFGLLSSAFIIGHSILSIVFGYFALKYRPFRIIALGTSIWIVAVIICGIAQTANSYYVLIIGRVISGVGEASFQCIAPPFIDRHAPVERRSFYVGIYLASVIVGTALGFVYGSLFADSVFTWAGAFYFEAILMLVLVSACLFCVPTELNQAPTAEENAASNPALRQPLTSSSELASELLSKHSLDGSPAGSSPHVRSGVLDPEKQQSVYWMWWEIMSNVPFLLVILAHGAYTFTLGVFNTFGPDVFIGLGLFTSETSASFIFGGIVAVTSLIGTPLGGMALDKLTKNNVVPGRRCFVAVSMLFVCAIVAEVFALGLYAFPQTEWLFLTCFTIALFAMCALWGPEMVAVLELFPESRRSMAISANAVVIHVFGDVPAPIIMGYVRDAWAPLCGTVEIDGDAHLNPDCPQNYDGLKNFILLSVLWLTWAVLLWALALVAIKRRQKIGAFPTPMEATVDTPLA
jgi:MFS family permease